MAYHERPLMKNGIIPFLEAIYNERYSSFSAQRFNEIMGYNIPERLKLTVIAAESGKSRVTAKTWLDQWEREQK